MNKLGLAIGFILSMGIMIAILVSPKNITDKAKPQKYDVEFSRQEFEIEKARQRNAEKMKGIVENKKKQRETQVPLINKGRIQEKTKNYLKIIVSHSYHELSAFEIQKLFNDGWELIAMKAGRFSPTTYIFKKMELNEPE